MVSFAIFASSTKPDQIMLTWSGSPMSTIDIQWRTSTEDADGIVQYWIDGKNDTLTTTASKMRPEDRMLHNDRFVNRFTAHLDGLQPGSTYAYQVGTSRKKSWSAVKQFDSRYFYQTMDIDGESLKYSAIDSEGVVRDEFVIEK
jgi:hypothetical protein